MNKKTIVVTGGSGFIGSEVVYLLIKKGYKVRVVDLVKPAYKHKGVEFVKKDLRKSTGLEKVFTNASVCIHLAAHIGNAMYGNANQSAMLQDNIQIDLNTVNAAAKSKMKQFIYISSSLVYEQAKKFPVKEKDAPTMPSPLLSYSFEKLLGEKICKTYARDFKFAFTICRLFNAYGVTSLGHEESHKHVIAHILDKMASGQYPLSIYGSGKQKRNFTHVRDLAKGIVATVDNKRAYDSDFNIGNPKEYSVHEIIELLWKSFYKDKKLKLTHLPSVGTDVEKNYPSIAKSKKLLKWKPMISMKEGLAELVLAHVSRYTNMHL